MTAPTDQKQYANTGDDLPELTANAIEASRFLKSLAHDRRLIILCHLVNDERTVSELEVLTGSRQAAVSQQLAKLRDQGLVAARREGKSIYYRLTDERVSKLIEVLYDLFCKTENEQP